MSSNKDFDYEMKRTVPANTKKDFKRKLSEDTRTNKEILKDFYDNGFM